MNQELRLQVFGWVLFVFCAVLYMIDNVASGSLISLMGSVLFLVACLVFMYPVVRRWWYG